MNTTVNLILEILKFTIPALIVFLTVYFMLKKHFENQIQLESIKLTKSKSDRSLPIKIQAYERLTLFLERISIPNLVMRLRNRNMTAKELEHAMMVSIQKEYEHNLAQQIYISEKLWQIIELAKDQNLNFVASTAAQMDERGTADELIEQLMNNLRSQKMDPIGTALTAIKKEIKLII